MLSLLAASIVWFFVGNPSAAPVPVFPDKPFVPSAGSNPSGHSDTGHSVNTHSKKIRAKDLVQRWCADISEEEALRLEEHFKDEVGVLATVAAQQVDKKWARTLLLKCYANAPLNPDVMSAMLLAGIQSPEIGNFAAANSLIAKLKDYGPPYTSIAALFDAKSLGNQGDPAKVVSALTILSREDDPGKFLSKVRENDVLAWNFLGRSEDGILARQLMDTKNTLGFLISDVIGHVDPTLWTGKASSGDSTTRALLFDALDRVTRDDHSSIHGYLESIGIQKKIINGTPESALGEFIPDAPAVKQQTNAEWKETVLLHRGEEELPFVFNGLTENERGDFVEEAKRDGEVKAWKELLRKRPELFLKAVPSDLTPGEWQTLFNGNYPYPTRIGAN